MKFLEVDELKRLEADHRLSPTRVPIKIDLRDLGAWLRAKNPFGPGDPATTNLTLETFISHLISHFSGGQTFTVDDFYHLIDSSAVLIVLDGLDEVASTADRADVIEAVTVAAARIRDRAMSTQFVVTSRPASMPNAPRFARDTWTYASLTSISNVLIADYSLRWASARAMPPEEAEELKSNLLDRLRSEHIRELARNPMQLTILLWLVNARGQSLPDQRTRLYDSYMEVFFNREAEKSAVVRDNRDLLLSLHGFIAWRIHSAAENNPGASGSITQDELLSLIHTYLKERHFDLDVDELFQGLVQRVVALVSRVEGTFEFEVQPLREYFAARHLYDTSPYSPVGTERENGTKPQIFAALAPNSYWQNVVRFYAGCYSDGELPSLSLQLREMVGDGPFALTSTPRVLATRLLADRVFTKQPMCAKELVLTVVDDITIALSNFAHFGMDDETPQLLLPGRDGGVLVRQILWEKLRLAPVPTRFVGPTSALQSTAPNDQLWSEWAHDAPARNGEDLLKWIDLAGQLGLIEYAREQNLSIVSPEKIDGPVLTRLIENDYLSEIPSREVRSAVLNGNLVFRSGSSPEAWLSRLLRSVYWSGRGQIAKGMALPENEGSAGRPVDTTTVQVVQALYGLASGRQRSGIRDVNFGSVVDILLQTEPGCWHAYAVANLAASVADRSLGRGRSHTQMFDDDTSVLERMRYARYRSRDSAYWREQLVAAGGDSARVRAWLLSLLSWGSSAVVQDLAPEAKQIASDLTQAQYALMYQNLDQVWRARRQDRLQDPTPFVGGRERWALAGLMCTRGSRQFHTEFSLSAPLRLAGQVVDLSRLVIRNLLTTLLAADDPTVRTRVHARTREAWAHGDGAFIDALEFRRPPKLEAELAMRILRKADNNTPSLVWAANYSQIQAAYKFVRPVDAIAREQNWAANVTSSES